MHMYILLCMHLYVHVCVWCVSMYRLNVHVCMHACMYVCMYVLVSLSILARMHACTYAESCKGMIQSCMCLCAHCVCRACEYIRAGDIHDIHVYICICMYVCMYVYIYIYIYIYGNRRERKKCFYVIMYSTNANIICVRVCHAAHMTAAGLKSIEQDTEIHI